MPVDPTKIDLDAIQKRMDAANAARGLYGETTYRFVGECPVEVGAMLTSAPTDVAALLAECRALRERVEKLERVVEAARAWSDCIEQGFTSELRPDIARRNVNAALASLDKEPK